MWCWPLLAFASKSTAPTSIASSENCHFEIMRNYFVLLFRCWVACDLFSLRSPKNKKYHLWGFRQQGSCHRHGWRTKGRARRHWCDIGICSFLSDYICNVTFNVVDLRSKTCQSSIWSIESIQDRSVPNSSDITIAILSLICWAQVSGVLWRPGNDVKRTSIPCIFCLFRFFTRCFLAKQNPILGNHGWGLN